MKKRVISFGLAAVMSFAMLSGCGTREEKVTLSRDELLTKAVESMETIDSIELDVSGKLNGEATIEGQDIKLNGSATAEGVGTVKEPSLHLTGKVDYNYEAGNSKASGEHTAEVYGECDKENELFYTYARLDDRDWNVSEDSMPDFSEDISEMVDDAKEAIKEISEDKTMSDLFKLNETLKKVNGKKCYLIYADIDKEVLKNIVGQESEVDAEEMEYFDKLNISYKIYFDKDTYYPVKFVLSAEIKAEVEEEGYFIDLKECEFEVNAKVNKAEPVKVPQAIKDSAKETELDGSSSLSEVIGL
ncbi:MAG: hypothetical protein IJC76_09750 [Lachnospiraceae bacterium]|nr:hypothetical protein [Lachnospiraceae bacterium]